MMILFLTVFLCIFCTGVGQTNSNPRDSFLNWVAPERLSKDERLKVKMPKWEELVYTLGSEKYYATFPRASVLWIPTEGKGAQFFKKGLEKDQKKRISADEFIKEHRSWFELVDPELYKESKLDPKLKDPAGKIVILAKSGQVVIP